ncbi:MAG TPA: YfhO family protein, partial [Chroococcales cyanobacterium]
PIETPQDYRVAARVPETPTFFSYAQSLLWPNTHMNWHVRETFGYEACATRNYINLYYAVLNRSKACRKHKCPIEAGKETSQSTSQSSTSEPEFEKDNNEDNQKPKPTQEKVSDPEDRSDMVSSTISGPIVTTITSREERSENSDSIVSTSRTAKDKKSDEKDLSDFPLYRFCQSTGTKWIGTQIIRCSTERAPVLDANYFETVYEDEPMNLRISRVKHTLPRAYLSQYWSYQKSQARALSRIAGCDKHKYNPALVTWIYPSASTGTADVQGTVRALSPLLPLAPRQAPEIPAEVRHSTDWSAADPLIEKWPVAVMVDEPEHVSMSFKTDRYCWLVLTDHYYPGWQAYIDGVRRPIFKCNTDMRAVYVPPGAHLIEFNYEPESFKLGCYLSLAAAVLLVLLLLRFFAPYFWRSVKRMAGQS